MKFPHYQQLDLTDCGPSSLRIIAAYYGKHFSQQYLREKCHITRDGVSMLGISDAAEAIGFRTMGVKLTWAQLCDQANLPCIVHWNNKHFVVVYKIKKSRSGYKIYVSDPANDKLVYGKDAFLKCWLVNDPESNVQYGTALLLEPTPNFYDMQEGLAGKLDFRRVLLYIKPYKNYLFQVVIALLLGSILNLIMPFLTQSVVDVGIGNSNINFVVMVLVAQVMLTVGQMVNDLIRSWLMLHITTRTSISLISDFLCKMMKLPMGYFSSKNVGDIMQRIGDHSRIQSFLTGSLIGIFMAAVTFVVYSIIMTGYNLTILLIFLLGSILYIGWVLLFLKTRRKLDYMRFQEASSNQTSLVHLITGIQDIKLNNCEKTKRWEWERIQAKLFHISVKGLTLSQTQQVGGSFINQTKNVMISFIAASAVINGDMTLGMMMAMQYIIGQLNGPISQFISFVQALQDAKISLERLNEIHGEKEEEPDESIKIFDIPQKSDIVLKDIVFQYDGPHSDKVLDNVNLTIPADRVTAIVGASGSGKTTLIKLVLGFYSPIQGEILLRKRPLSDYSIREWRNRCGVVMQEGYVFSDTIMNNITVYDENPDMNRIREDIRLANIEEYIDSLPLGLKTKIGEGGQGFSSGQKQRILIARALYKNADYLFLDEATNSLDAKNEREIMESFSQIFRGRTVVIVAHRLSTVKHADNIVVMDKGKIVEQGCHSELVQMHGYYYNLVKNQMELDK